VDNFFSEKNSGDPGITQRVFHREKGKSISLFFRFFLSFPHVPQLYYENYLFSLFFQREGKLF